MSLTDTVTDVMEDFSKRRNKSETWAALETKLKKIGLGEVYNKLIREIDSSEAYKLLKVWDMVDERLNKKKLTWGCRKRKTFEVIRALSEIEDIEEVIKTLEDSGFELPPYKDIFTYTFLDIDHLKLFESLSKDKSYERYGPVSKALNKLDYKGPNGYPKSKQIQLEHLTNIISLKGDVAGAMYVLANNLYKIDETVGLDSLDIKSIKKIIAEDEKEASEGKGGIPVYLYNTGNLEMFQDYFNSLKTENKKSVLKSILEYETKEERKENNKAREWLEKNYECLIREIGFEDVK